MSTADGPVTFDGGSGWSDGMLRTLGRVVLQFSSLEWCAERLLAGFIADSELVMVVVAGQDMSWKLDRLEQMHGELVQTKATDALKGWLEGARTLNAQRNQLVHSVWSTNPEGAPVGVRVRRGNKWDARGQVVTADMLDDLLVHVGVALNLAVKISAALGDHPQWKGHPLNEASGEDLSN